MKKLGEKMVFTGGAEVSPKVEITEYYQPGSMNHREQAISITQGNTTVQISPLTLVAILRWYGSNG
jgi:hypothetical protein